MMNPAESLKRSLLVLLLLIGSCTAGSESPTARQPDLAALTILHWNDFHSQNVPFKIVLRDSLRMKDSVYYVGGTANLLGYIKHFRGERSEVAVLNAGDDFQGTPISSMTNGRSQIELMNIINPDAMTLGNHEFDYGLENLEKNLHLARFPILNANIFDKRTGKPFVAPYLVKTFGRVTVGIIGLITPDLPILTMRQHLEGLQMLNYVQVVRKYVAELKKQHVDLIVVLSHMGVDTPKVKPNTDQALADSVADIDVIIGGHSHTALFRPIKQNRTVICQAGTRGRWLGKLDLLVDLSGDSVYSYQSTLIETVLGKVTPDPIAEAKATEFESTVAKELTEVIGTLETDWIRHSRRESNIGNWAADVMRGFGSADVAFLNSGTLRKDLYAGDITARDIWEIFPFNNHFVTFRVTGTLLRDMIAWQAAGKAEFMQVSGIRYVYDSSKPDDQRVFSIEVGGKPLDDKTVYTIVTNNYVGGHLHDFFGLREAEIELTPLKGYDHDVFMDAVRQQRRIASKIEGRIVDVAKQ
jgi:5'-nucleotidase/UDP-sugar diphosphatase